MKLTAILALCISLFLSACSKDGSVPEQEARFTVPDFPRVILRSNCVLGQSPWCLPNVYKFMADTAARRIRIEEDTVSHNVFSLFQYDREWRLQYFFYRNTVGGGDTIHFIRNGSNSIDLRSSVFNSVYKRITIEPLAGDRTKIKVDDLGTDPSAGYQTWWFNSRMQPDSNRITKAGIPDAYWKSVYHYSNSKLDSMEERMYTVSTNNYLAIRKFSFMRSGAEQTTLLQSVKALYGADMTWANPEMGILYLPRFFIDESMDFQFLQGGSVVQASEPGKTHYYDLQTDGVGRLKRGELRFDNLANYYNYFEIIY